MCRKWALVLVLSVLLCGCDSSTQGSSDDSEPTQMSVQSGLISFLESTVQVDPSDLEGTWVDAENGTTMILNRQGRVTVEKTVNGEHTVEQLNWTIDDKGLTITDPQGGKLSYKVVEKDGQIQIMGSGSVYTSLEDQESLLSQEVNFLGMGETAATDLVKLTLNGIEFSPAVSLTPEDYLLPDPRGPLAAQAGNLMACLSFRVQNLMDEGLSEQNFCNLELEYDHIYSYGQGYYGVPGAASVGVEAGGRADYRAAIECAEMVAEDNSVSLCIHLTLPSSEGEVHFTYVLK